MPTLTKLDQAFAQAQSLHALLATFALDTLEPSAKAMWTSQATATKTVLQSISDRRQQLLAREATIAQAQQAVEDASAITRAPQL